eukprot:g29269.t1
MEIIVMTNGTTTNPFPICTGGKQGCIIAQTLFSIYLAAMLHFAVEMLPTGVELAYRTCGKLFNLCRLQAKAKVTPTIVIELQCAEDACIHANSKDKLQTIGSILTEAYKNMGLTLNIASQRSPTNLAWYCGANSNHQGPLRALENVGQFQYLRGVLWTKADIAGHQRKRVFKDSNIRSDTKLM